MSRTSALTGTFAMHLRRLGAALLFAVVAAGFARAQETAVVPHVVQFKGAVTETHPGKAEVVFALYKEQTDQVPLWQETQSVAIDAAGHYAVLLGAGSADGIPAEVFSGGAARWLGVTVEGQAEQSRVLLTSVPYAMKASDAETLGGLPASAFLRESELVAAGTAPVATNGVGPATGKAAKPNAAITATGAKTGYLPVFTDATGDLGSSLIAETSKYVGIGTATPANPLTVAGTIQSSTGGFLFPDSTTQLTAVPKCTVSGQYPQWSGAAWACVTPTLKPGTGLSGSYLNGALTLNTSAVTSATLGKGLTGSIASNALTLNTDTTYLQQRVTGNCTTGSAIASIAQAGTVTCQAVGGGGGITLPVNWTGAATAPAGVLNVTDTTTGPAMSKGSTPNFSLVPSATVGTASGNGTVAGIVGRATGAETTGVGVGVLGLASGSQGMAVLGYTTGTGDIPAIIAWSAATTGSAAGYDAEIYSPNADGYRVNMDAPAGTGKMFGGSTYSGGGFSVDANANINTSGGLTVSGSTRLYGGISNGLTVNGNLNVTGSVNKSSGTFKIDHPLDPANKYLSHSFVESPDMMNIYNGNVVTDSRGVATVELPSYFEALNQDFRYQLTVIGQFAQAIVAKEIANNRFTIQTDKPAVKDSWQVTGIRHDAYAEAHRVVVEEEKPAPERGTYLHPELFTNAPEAAEGK